MHLLFKTVSSLFGTLDACFLHFGTRCVTTIRLHTHQGHQGMWWKTQQMPVDNPCGQSCAVVQLLLTLIDHSSGRSCVVSCVELCRFVNLLLLPAPHKCVSQ